MELDYWGGGGRGKSVCVVFSMAVKYDGCLFVELRFVGFVSVVSSCFRLAC